MKTAYINRKIPCEFAFWPALGNMTCFTLQTAAHLIRGTRAIILLRQAAVQAHGSLLPS